MLLRRFIHRLQLPGAKPLQPHIKTHLISMLRGKFAHRFAFGLLVFRRPARPTQHMRVGKMLRQRFKHAPAIKRCAFFFHKPGKLGTLLLPRRRVILIKCNKGRLKR